MKDIKEILDKIEEESTYDDQIMFGSKELGPDYHSIIQLLHNNPILVRPTLNYLQQMSGKLAAAQMLTLYSVDQLKKMYSEEEWKVFENLYLK